MGGKELDIPDTVQSAAMPMPKLSLSTSIAPTGSVSSTVIKATKAREFLGLEVHRHIITRAAFAKELK